MQYLSFISLCISASSEPKIQAKGGGIQIKKPGLFGNSRTVINIRSAQNVQIGNNNTMIVNSSGTGRQRRNRDVSPPPATKPSRVDKERVKQVLGKYLPVMVTPTTGHFSSRARFQMHLYSKIHLNGPYQETPLL